MVGYGKMGAAIVAQWRAAANERFAGHNFVVIDPALASDAPSDDARIAYLAEPPPPADCAFDLVIAAVKPQVIDRVLPDYAARLAPGGFVASIAAGCSLERIRTLAGGAPAIRIMPNLPAAIGRGVSGLCADDQATDTQRDMIETLMAAVGTVVWVADEDGLDRLTAVAGSGPGYVFELARSYVAAVKAMGFDAPTARQLALGTLSGAIAMAEAQDETPLEALRDSVTSKGGTTAAGLAALNGDGLLDARFAATFDAAYARAVELR